MKTTYVTLIISIFVNTILADDNTLIPPIEIVMKTINTGGEMIYFKASSLTNRWDNSHYLTTSHQEESLSVNGDNLSCDYGFGFGNCEQEVTLAYSIYKISVENSGKEAWFKIDAIGCTYYGDVYITYDYSSDDFYLGGGCSSAGTTPINEQTLILYYNSECLQPTTPNDLTYFYLNNRLNITWDKSEPDETACYEIWRKIMGGFKYLGFPEKVIIY